MQLLHDYAILGEEENQSPQESTLPLNEHFQNFSNLLQAQKQRQKSKILMPLELNNINQSTNAIKSSTRSSPRSYFSKQSHVPSVEKIMQRMVLKNPSQHQQIMKKEQFYDRQIRWLNQVKQSNILKNQNKITQEIKNCPFKPFTSPQQQSNKENNKVNCKSVLSPQQPFKKPNQRNDSYSKIHLAKKSSLG